MNFKQLILIVVIFFFSLSSLALESVEIRRVMEQMNQNMIKAKKAMLQGNSMELYQAAKELEKEPDLSFMERLRVFADVGTQITDFKTWSEEVTKSAKQLAKTAREKDLSAQKLTYQQLVESCVGCHEQFVTHKKIHLDGALF